MKWTRFITLPRGWLFLAAVVLAIAAAVPLLSGGGELESEDWGSLDNGWGGGGGWGGGNVQPFQFSDAFYLEQGLDPTTLFDKYVFPDAKPGVCNDPFDPASAPPCRTKSGTSPDPNVYNDVRVVETTGGFDKDGDLLYYTTPAKVLARDFLDNRDGEDARKICDEFRAFLFPKADGNPLSPMPPNRRHDNIFDTGNRYFSRNPLGCWRLNFVAWDGPDVGSQQCQDFMDYLVARRISESPSTDGLDLDGTPVLRELREIEDGEKDGCLTIRVRDANATENPGFPWVV